MGWHVPCFVRYCFRDDIKNVLELWSLYYFPYSFQHGLEQTMLRLDKSSRIFTIVDYEVLEQQSQILL